MKKIIIAPSILNANFLNLSRDLDSLKDIGIEWIHYDVMDYHFVPNLSFGPDILKQITKKYDFKIDVHLMVEINCSVKEYLKSFFEAGVHQITFHLESLSNEQINEFIKICKENNVLSSLSIKPKTNVEEIEKYLPFLNNVLVMSVEPGFGGQKFIENSIEKINLLDKKRNLIKNKFTIQIDGGINDLTIKHLINSQIDIAVAGSYLLNGGATKEKLEKISYV